MTDEPPRASASTQSSRAIHVVVLAWLGECRRRWVLATSVGLLAFSLIASYALLAIPKYRATGALQVSTGDAGGANPLLELTGMGSGGEVETEVEIIRQPDFVLAALKELRLNVVDPEQPRVVTIDLSVALGGRSPVSPGLRAVRSALVDAQVASDHFGNVPVRLWGLADERLYVEIGSPEDIRVYEIGIEEPLEDVEVRLEFASIPLAEGEMQALEIVCDGFLVDDALGRFQVSTAGRARNPTNLVQISYVDPDRETARAVVQLIMERSMDQSLQWQSLSATRSAEFIEQRLVEADKSLREEEEALRAFAAKEHAVQLDTQARVTIESASAIEAQRMQVELQERVLDGALAGMKAGKNPSAHLTTTLVEDPVLTGAIASLTENETRYAVLAATLTEDHPKVREIADQVELQRGEVKSLMKNARKGLSARRQQLELRAEEVMGSLSTYPDKQVELARFMREVDVSQRMYSFLLEKLQEAEILKASTTTDKRIVDNATLPHRNQSPDRGKLLAFAILAAMLSGPLAVYLAHSLQRKLQTVEAVRGAVCYPMYGTIPRIAEAAMARVSPRVTWARPNEPGVEAFRALCVSVSLIPKPEGRARIVQLTSSQPGEGKSTVAANLATSLAKSGARVLLVDLDLRKPVQHRIWGLPRAPGYAELMADHAGRGPIPVELVRREEVLGVDIVTAGTKLPDTLGGLMGEALRKILERMAAQYDYLIVDSPPAFVADTTVVAQWADLVLVVARPGVLERGNLREAIASLDRLDCPKGLVLNGVTRDHAEYYYGGNYYYGRTYAEEGEEKREAS